jgi:hypothetical protein
METLNQLANHNTQLFDPQLIFLFLKKIVYVDLQSIFIYNFL